MYSVRRRTSLSMRISCSSCDGTHKARCGGITHRPCGVRTCITPAAAYSNWPRGCECGASNWPYSKSRLKATTACGSNCNLAVWRWSERYAWRDQVGTYSMEYVITRFKCQYNMGVFSTYSTFTRCYDAYLP